jgi:hypothetical protein
VTAENGTTGVCWDLVIHELNYQPHGGRAV